MRMVYTHAPEEVFYPARDRLVAEFGRWAGRSRASADPFVVEAMVEHRWSEGDGLLGRWQPDDLGLLLCEWFPRAVTMRADEWAMVLPTVRGFLDFLHERGLADARGAEPEVLHAALDALADDFDRAMADPARYGPAKFWSLRMLDAGVDPADPEAAQRFIDDVRAGRVEVDEVLLEQVMVGHFERMDAESPPPLPVVALRPNDELRAAAAKSRMVNRLVEFVEWVGDGRVLTATGRLRLADAREVISLLGLADVIDPRIGQRTVTTKSSDELYETSIVLAWARVARIVRVVKGRLLPVKSARKLVHRRWRDGHAMAPVLRSRRSARAGGVDTPRRRRPRRWADGVDAAGQGADGRAPSRHGRRRADRGGVPGRNRRSSDRRGSRFPALGS
ncbi:hypothetical protein [Cryptosporangium japonicum]|uniref:Uncharacterized protein n=1 Tax=Cryptosporangium japonicum TaxID=80872 RepID=A0ABP3D8P2_9ACTN